MYPYHVHVHRRRGGFFRGLLLVGLGFFLARATEHHRRLDGPRGPPVSPHASSSSSAQPATSSSADEGPWGGRRWCRRHWDRQQAQQTQQQQQQEGLAYGPAEVKGEDVPAVLAALAAFQRSHAEQPSVNNKPAETVVQPAVQVQAEAAPVHVPHAAEHVTAPATSPAPASTVEAQQDRNRQEDLARIDRMTAALERLRAAIEKSGTNEPRLV